MTNQPIAIVPARLASQRLARKMLADLAGAPLIVRVCENLSSIACLARVVVATDHADIASAVLRAGFEAVFTDPELPSGTDRVAAAASALMLEPNQAIINVQGDEPFIAEATIEALSTQLNQSPEAIVTPIVHVAHTEDLANPNVVKVALGAQHRALYFSRSAIPHQREDGNSSSWYFRHLGVYAYRASTLSRIAAFKPHPLEKLEKLEQLRWLAHGESMLAVEVDSAHRGIDSAEDLAAANELFRKLRRS